MTPIYRPTAADVVDLLTLPGGTPGRILPWSAATAVYVDPHLVLLLFLLGSWVLYEVLVVIDILKRHTGDEP